MSLSHNQGYNGSFQFSNINNSAVAQGSAMFYLSHAKAQ